MLLDLIQMLGLPEHVDCPFCAQAVATNFDRVEAWPGDAHNPDPGAWHLPLWCEHCTHQWIFAFTVTLAHGDQSNAFC